MLFSGTMVLPIAVSLWYEDGEAFHFLLSLTATFATGGFSTHDASLGYFKSPLVESIAIVFMLLGGINFAVHIIAWRARGIRSYLHDASAIIPVKFGGRVLADTVIESVWGFFALNDQYRRAYHTDDGDRPSMRLRRFPWSLPAST